VAVDLQQRKTQHGHRGNDPSPEIENRRLNSTKAPRKERGNYHCKSRLQVLITDAGLASESIASAQTLSARRRARRPAEALAL
jgi:hypothetical protein